MSDSVMTNRGGEMSDPVEGCELACSMLGCLMGERLSDVSETVLSPLGAVSVRVSGGQGATIQVAKPDIPELPEGMAVDGVTLIRIDIAAPVIQELPVLLQVTAYRNGDPETGEWLDSMAFISPEGVLQVAVHDSDWLAVNGVVADPVQ